MLKASFFCMFQAGILTSICNHMLLTQGTLWKFSHSLSHTSYSSHLCSSQPCTGSLWGNVTAPHLWPCHAPVAACHRAFRLPRHGTKLGAYHCYGSVQRG